MQLHAASSMKCLPNVFVNYYLSLPDSDHPGPELKHSRTQELKNAAMRKTLLPRILLECSSSQFLSSSARSSSGGQGAVGQRSARTSCLSPKRFCLGEASRFASCASPLLQHSITPLLHYSITPLPLPPFAYIGFAASRGSGGASPYRIIEKRRRARKTVVIAATPSFEPCLSERRTMNCER